MCGRFTRKESFQTLAEELELTIPVLEPRYNIAPSQMVACVRNASDNGIRECVMLKWGLVPSWAKDPTIGNKLINARAETIAEKPAFRRAFRNRRCLVIADGFYEWKREGRSKQPFYFRFRHGGSFAFAGIWDHWECSPQAPIESFALITTGPNEVMEPVHNRMPVILEAKDYDLWIDPTIHNNEPLLSLLHPFPSEDMEAVAISTFVNNPQHDDPRCIEPL